jgi:hypothetical protein
VYGGIPPSIGVGTPRWPVNNLVNWGVRTDDWEEYLSPLGLWIPRWKRDFTFSGTWEAIFDAIALGLPDLIDFRVEYEEHACNSLLSIAERLHCHLSLFAVC